MKTMFKYLCNLLNPFNMGETIKNVTDSIEIIEKRLSHIETNINSNIEGLTLDIEYYKSMIETIGDTIPDMMWLKDIKGKYRYANNSIKNNLLFDNDPIGKNDYELSIAAKQMFGAANHTFGDICGNSDIVVLNNLKPQRFLEYGKIKGKNLYLEVFKAPFYVNGKLIGVCGTGRDLTEYVEAYRRHKCDGCPKQMHDIFKKYEFKEDNYE